MKSFIDLTPHINLIDNFHYARNIYLPGSDEDLYSIEFSITPPQSAEIALHKDWKLIYGNKILKEYKFFLRMLILKKFQDLKDCKIINIYNFYNIDQLSPLFFYKTIF